MPCLVGMLKCLGKQSKENRVFAFYPRTEKNRNETITVSEAWAGLFCGGRTWCMDSWPLGVAKG